MWSEEWLSRDVEGLKGKFLIGLKHGFMLRHDRAAERREDDGL
jgi:hypothetical protein